ncbi:MAG: hypothetical protein A2Z20_03075 [Bdellovibrionales bacterium RBG_16_40_8]|nr:MAG: hypothetical protein A2Z20_03075 [Bdellovibrionales bacterium RBG_16_40_8]
MLEKVREPWSGSKSKSILAYIIFGLICVTFVFVGFSPTGTGISGGAGTAATVNDVVISLLDFQDQVNMIENQMGDSMKNIPAAKRQSQYKEIRNYALNNLVAREVAYQSAVRAGILPTISATRDMITNVPLFQENGRFAREKYKIFLANKNTTASDFENKIKRNVVIAELNELFLTALQTPKVMQDMDNQIRNTKIILDFVKIDSIQLTNALTVSNDAIAAFLSKPENQSKIKSYFEANKQEYSTQEQVRARHILLKGDATEVLTKITAIRKEAEKADFAELAKKYSEDEGSQSKGGDVNFFSRGQMVKEFENAAFSLPIGKVSDPIKTAYGYHLIKVEERREGETKTLESVQNEIAKKLVSDELKDESLQELSELLKNKKNISSWLDRFKLKWEDSGEFSLDQSYVPKINAGPEVFTSALNLKNPGEMLPNLVRQGPISYVLRLKKLTNPVFSSTKKIDSSSFRQTGSAEESLGLWAEELKKSALIHRNEAILN